MASPPFNLDTSNPADNAPENTYPANERPFRDNVQSYIGTEHDILSGHHMIPAVSSAARDAITNWPSGAIIFNTTVGFFQINTGSTVSPTWTADTQPPATPAGQVFTTNGTCVIAATQAKITLIGGGAGGGGGKQHATIPTGGGGGGAGAVGVKWLTGLTIGGTLAITIGAGGAGGTGSATPTDGTNGGNTVVASGTQSITTLTAPGGTKGACGQATVGGSGGAGGANSSNCDIITSGGDGAGGGIGSSAPCPGGSQGSTAGFGSLGFGGDGGEAEVGSASGGGNGKNGLVVVEYF